LKNSEFFFYSNRYRLLIIVAVAVVLFLIILFSLFTGTIKFSFQDILEIFGKNSSESMAKQILVNIRLPRILTGLFVGMNLSVAGVLLQGVLRNPMASPNIIGVNSGAGLAAVIIMTIFPGNVSLIPPASFIGALAASMLIYLLSYSTQNSRTVYVILAGIAVSNLLNALTSALMSLNSDTLEITYSWLLGSLSARGWTAFNSIWPYSLIALTVSIFISPKINLFGLGEEVASSVGLSTRFYRTIILLTSSILAGSAVSAAGTIGFVGLIAPHCARIIVGNDHRFLVPLSALIGAALLILSDTVARTLFQPVEISVGIITSLLGAPFFIFLLYRRRKEEKI